MRTMKYLLSFIALGVVLMSCQKDNSELLNENIDFVDVVLGANTDVTRSSLDGAVFSWVGGDMLGVYNTLSDNKPFTKGNDANSFNGQIAYPALDEILYTIYPYSAGLNKFVKESDQVKYTFTLPATQIQNHNDNVLDPAALGEYSYMVGRTADVLAKGTPISVKMLHVMSFIDVNLTNIKSGETVTSLTITSSVPLTTSAKVNFPLVGTALTVESLSTSDNITLDVNNNSVAGVVADANGELTLRFAIFPQTLPEATTWNASVVIAGVTYSFEKKFNNETKCESGAQNRIAYNVVASGDPEEGAKKATVIWTGYDGSVTGLDIESTTDVLHSSTGVEVGVDGGKTCLFAAALPEVANVKLIAIYLDGVKVVIPNDKYSYVDGIITVNYNVIANASHFDIIRNGLSGSYTQVADITLAENWTPIGSSSVPFTGVYDGGNFSIFNFNTSDATQQHVGFVASNEGEIRNLTIASGTIKGAKYVGAFAGRNVEGTINNCFNSATITSVGTASYFGGICGENVGGRIVGCGNNGVISENRGGSYHGGICGGSHKSGTVVPEIVNCYNKGSVRSGNILGGITGASSGIIRASYNAGEVRGYMSSKGMCGGIVGSNNGGSTTYACYNRGSVNGISNTGGVVGTGTGATYASYSVGQIVKGSGAQATIGAVVGNQSGAYSKCYWSAITVNGIGRFGSVTREAFEFSADAWPVENAADNWGIYTVGANPEEGYYWKSLGSWNGGVNPVYPQLYWE